MNEFLGDFALSDYRTLLATTIGFGQTLFALIYLRYRWYENKLGRVLFGNALVFAITFDWIAFARWTGRGREDLLFAALYTAVCISIWVQLFTFIAIQRRGRFRS